MGLEMAADRPTGRRRPASPVGDAPPFPTSRAVLEAFQLARLRRLGTHARRGVPYYRALLDAHGFRPERLRSLADVSAIAVST